MRRLMMGKVYYGFRFQVSGFTIDTIGSVDTLDSIVSVIFLNF